AEATLPRLPQGVEPLVEPLREEHLRGFYVLALVGRRHQLRQFGLSFPLSAAEGNHLEFPAFPHFAGLGVNLSNHSPVENERKRTLASRLADVAANHCQCPPFSWASRSARSFSTASWTSSRMLRSSLAACTFKRWWSSAGMR